jgi:predicted O-linked N-acetylglucosamine transferase (SPINDLY family)
MTRELEAQDWFRLAQRCKQALRKNPTHQWAHRYLGFALHKAHRDEEALEAFRVGTLHWPNDAEMLLNHAQTLMELGQEWKALPILEKVVALRPDHYTVWLKLSQALYRTQAHSRGWECALKTEEFAQTDAERAMALLQKAIHRRELGQIKQAVEDCEASLRYDPNEITAHTNRLLFMLADPDVTVEHIRQAAAEYAHAVEDPLKPSWPHHDASSRQPWEPLRIGFLSPDLRNHSVMYFVEGLLAQLDRRQFSVVALHLHPGADNITERAKRHADEFIELANRPFKEQVQMIRDAKLDIVIDLAGHTGNNGLLLMATKQAPLQVSWLGYPATTGLSAINYKFTDEVTDPEGAEVQYSEQLYRMPTLFCCYRPHSRNPLWRYQPAFQVQPTPALRNGYVTFGSCNNLGKLTDPVLSLWAQLLRRLPDARLLIEGKNLDKPDFRQAYLDRCQRLDLPLDRLDLVPLDIRNQYLTYHRIDIALDPFPLTGGTTSFDLLWMGLPLVSLIGDSFKSRLSTGLLAYLGETDWLAQTTEGYLDVAVRLASDVHALNSRRLTQRERVESSPLMDETAFNTEFGNGLRVIWLHWLAQQRCPEDPQAQQDWMQATLNDMPAAWQTPAEPGVGLSTGVRISRAEAHARLQEAVDRAKQAAPSGDRVEHADWRAVTELAEIVLCAIPHDPVALSCLAEVEHAHGHTDFAVTYLNYAVKAMGQQP